MAQRMKPRPKDWVQKIEITTVPYASMRYKTPGDWLRTKDGVLHIAVPEEMGEESCIAVAIHELLETLL